MNAADLISQYIKLRDYKEKRTKEFEAEMKPYADAMAAIANAGNAMLVAQSGGDEGKANIVTPAGTMYRSRWTAVKIADRDTFMGFVGSNFNDNQKFLTAAVSKKEIEEYIDVYKAIPPGLDVARGYNTLFKRS